MKLLLMILCLLLAGTTGFFFERYQTALDLATRAVAAAEELEVVAKKCLGVK